MSREMIFKKIKILLDYDDMSISKFCRTFGVSQYKFREYRDSKSDITFKEIEKIADYFKINTNYFCDKYSEYEFKHNKEV